MTRQRLSNSALSRLLGADRSQVRRWRAGIVAPDLPSAERLAEALGSEGLRRAYLAERRRRCAACAATFVDRGRPGRRAALYCNARCRNAAWGRRDRVRRAADAAYLAQRRLAVYQSAVAAHCRDCEPGGVCHDGACHLRDVSPLPFARMNR
jgi:transcriptional regulator with XRE-family HTH domain